MSRAVDVAVAAFAVAARRHARLLAQRDPRAGPPPRSRRASSRVDRHHRSVGVGHQRRLAVADGDAAERRYRERAAERGRAQGGGRVGPARRPARGDAVQGVRPAGADSTARRASASDGRTPPRCSSSSTRARRPAGSASERAPAGARSLQGHSAGAVVPPAAEPRHLRPRGPPRRAARSRWSPTNLQAGYLRPNGVPYSERTIVKEFFDSFTLRPTTERGSSSPQSSTIRST